MLQCIGGKKNLTLFLRGIDESVKLTLFEIKVKELSENFNTVYILRKSIDDTYKKYKDCVASYENFMNNKVKKWY